MQDGSTLTSSKIYSNTNFIANGSEVRRNTAPVLVVNGKVTLNGQVFLRGDEAPTGTDPRHRNQLHWPERRAGKRHSDPDGRLRSGGLRRRAECHHLQRRQRRDP